jgi:hypothetical protein
MDASGTYLPRKFLVLLNFAGIRHLKMRTLMQTGRIGTANDAESMFTEPKKTGGTRLKSVQASMS